MANTGEGASDLQERRMQHNRPLSVVEVNLLLLLLLLTAAYKGLAELIRS